MLQYSLISGGSRGRDGWGGGVGAYFGSEKKK